MAFHLCTVVRSEVQCADASGTKRGKNVAGRGRTRGSGKERGDFLAAKIENVAPLRPNSEGVRERTRGIEAGIVGDVIGHVQAAG